MARERVTNNSNKKNLSPKRNAGKSKTSEDEDRRRQSPSANSNKQTYWDEEWLSIEEYQLWLRADGHTTTLARCITCNAKIKLGNMGIGAVKSHAKGERHLKILASSKPKGSRSVKEMLLPHTEQVQEARGENGENEVVDLDQAVANEVGSVSVSPFVISEKVVDAEIIWALKNVMDHHSKRSVDEDAETFRRMFPDSQIAQKFKLGRTKLSYVLYYGLAEYFRQLLREDLRKCQYFVVAFDESFNTISQRGQMDTNGHIKFFDENGELVCTRYLTSVFMRAASSNDLLAHFKEGLAELPLNKMLQVSMDGPNVNWKFIQLLEEDLWMKPGTPQNFPRFLNLGSCGLHVVHGAFNTGHDKAGWTLHTALSNAYWLFKDSSVRRAAFQALSGQDTFPKKFCRVRWVENVATASTFLSIYDELKRFVQTEDKELKKKLTKMKSWQNLKKQFDDPFLKAKLLFFNSIAQDVEPFLRQFQSSYPLAPLLYEECHDMVRGMMRRFVKNDVMKSASSVPLLMAIKLSEDDLSNLKDVKNLNLGFATTQEINALEKTVGKKNSKVSALNILEFKTECRKFCLHFTAKMIQRSPLRYEAVKAISCLSPIIIAKKPKRAEERMQLLLQILNENHWIPSTKAERVVNQFNDLLEQSSSNPSMKEAFEGWSIESRLDEFYSSVLTTKNLPRGFDDLKAIIKMVLILSHGNATVESGFSINKAILVENLREESLVKQRMVYDAVSFYGGHLKVPITPAMRKEVSFASRRYKSALEEKKKEIDDAPRSKAQKRKIEDDLEKLRKEEKRIAAKAAEDTEEIRKKARLLEQRKALL